MYIVHGKHVTTVSSVKSVAKMATMRVIDLEPSVMPKYVTW